MTNDEGRKNDEGRSPNQVPLGVCHLRLLSFPFSGIIRHASFLLVCPFAFALLATAPAQSLNLPPRPTSAPTGSQFIDIITPMSLTERENWIYAEVASGNVPNFLRTLVPVTVSASVSGTNHSGTYYAAPDYLAIGTDANY